MGCNEGRTTGHGWVYEGTARGYRAGIRGVSFLACPSRAAVSCCLDLLPRPLACCWARLRHQCAYGARRVFTAAPTAGYCGTLASPSWVPARKCLRIQKATAHTPAPAPVCLRAAGSYGARTSPCIQWPRRWWFAVYSFFK